VLASDLDPSSNHVRTDIMLLEDGGIPIIKRNSALSMAVQSLVVTVVFVDFHLAETYVEQKLVDLEHTTTENTFVENTFYR